MVQQIIEVLPFDLIEVIADFSGSSTLSLTCVQLWEKLGFRFPKVRTITSWNCMVKKCKTFNKANVRKLGLVWDWDAKKNPFGTHLQTLQLHNLQTLEIEFKEASAGDQVAQALSTMKSLTNLKVLSNNTAWLADCMKNKEDLSVLYYRVSETSFWNDHEAYELKATLPKLKLPGLTNLTLHLSNTCMTSEAAYDLVAHGLPAILPQLTKVTINLGHNHAVQDPIVKVHRFPFGSR
eukprot:TRINITY_DN66400_c7_g3_i2.p1 TRINITY_DN66400_c7_g3~~TRINITY_DN66400_c7_g3_i2.p1  ORF type:complete len:236 (-),score=18.85 TRINITY_DN66400_c7_g3_i2:25-732(-)